MSSSLNTNAAAAGQVATSNGGGLLGSLDYVAQIGQRALEGFYNFKLLKTDLDARNAEIQWRLAASRQLLGQQVGTGASPYGVTGVAGIPSSIAPGLTQAGMFSGSTGVLMVAGIGVALALILIPGRR